MRLVLTPEQHAFRESARAFYSQHVDPQWREQVHSFDDFVAIERAWDKTLFHGGWAAPAWPKEYGGHGLGTVERALLAEEQARVGAPLGLGKIGKDLVGPTLMRYGTPEQREHIRRIASGNEVWCQGFSEPNAGSDLASLRTRARRDGDEWVINGRKIWTTFAQFADMIFLLVRTGSVESRGAGISVLLVPMNSEGIHVRPIETMTGEPSFNEITFDDVRVPASALVAEENAGWTVVRTTLQHERGPNFCLARFTDIRRTLASMVESFRNGSVPTDHVGNIGELYSRAFGVQLMVNDFLYREQRELVPQGLPSVMKLFTTELWRKMGDQQILEWGTGLFDDHGAQQVEDYLESRHYTISAGTSEIQRNGIAGQLLRMPSARQKGE